MSLFTNIEHLASAGGVIALAVDAPEQPRAFRGEDRWQPVLAGAIHLLSLTDQSSIRLVVGDHTMVVQREMKEVVAVVIPTGHAVAKSLRRMIRRMARKDRGPYVPEVAVSAPLPGRPPTQPLTAPATVAPGAMSSPASGGPSKSTMPGHADTRFSS